MTKLRQFLRDESGATAIEYTIIADSISIAPVRFGVPPEIVMVRLGQRA